MPRKVNDSRWWSNSARVGRQLVLPIRWRSNCSRFLARFSAAWFPHLFIQAQLICVFRICCCKIVLTCCYSFGRSVAGAGWAHLTVVGILIYQLSGRCPDSFPDTSEVVKQRAFDWACDYSVPSKERFKNVWILDKTRFFWLFWASNFGPKGDLFGQRPLRITSEISILLLRSVLQCGGFRQQHRQWTQSLIT